MQWHKSVQSYGRRRRAEGAGQRDWELMFSIRFPLPSSSIILIPNFIVK